MSEGEPSCSRFGDADTSTQISNSFKSLYTFGGNVLAGNSFSGGSSVHFHAQPQNGVQAHGLHPNLLASLSLSAQDVQNFELRENQLEDRRSPGTFEWIFQRNRNSPIMDWLLSRSPARVLWVQGKAGSGKSTFTNYLADHETLRNCLIEQCPNREVKILKHFFYGLGSKLQVDLSGLLRNLLYQLFMGSEEASHIALSACKNPPRQWNNKMLLQILTQIFQESSQGYCLFIEGLDEMSSDQTAQDQSTLLNFLTAISTTPSFVKACISGRPELKLMIKNTFRHLDIIDLHALTWNDMREAAQNTLEKSANYRRQKSVNERSADDLVRLLCDAAEGVFLWLHLVLEDLINRLEKTQDTLEMLIKRVCTFENALEKLLKQLLNRLNESWRTEACEIIRHQLEVEKQIVGDWEEDWEEYVLSSSVLLAACRSKWDSTFALLPSQSGNSCELVDSEGDLSQSFEQCICFAETLSAKTAGILEVSQAGCLARTLDDCRCRSLGSDVQNGMERLLEHFSVQRIQFIHRSAHTYFQENRSAKRLIYQDTDLNADRSDERIRAVRRMCSLKFECFFAPTMSRNLTKQANVYQKLQDIVCRMYTGIAHFLQAFNHMSHLIFSQKKSLSHRGAQFYSEMDSILILPKNRLGRSLAPKTLFEKLEEVQIAHSHCRVFFYWFSVLRDIPISNPGSPARPCVLSFLVTCVRHPHFFSTHKYISDALSAHILLGGSLEDCLRGTRLATAHKDREDMHNMFWTNLLPRICNRAETLTAGESEGEESRNVIISHVLGFVRADHTWTPVSLDAFPFSDHARRYQLTISLKSLVRQLWPPMRFTSSVLALLTSLKVQELSEIRKIHCFRPSLESKPLWPSKSPSQAKERERMIESIVKMQWPLNHFAEQRDIGEADMLFAKISREYAIGSHAATEISENSERPNRKGKRKLRSSA